MESSFLIAGLYSTTLHILYKNITLELAPLLIPPAIGAVAAGFLGIRLFRRLNRKMVQTVIYIALPIMAFLLLKS